MYIDRITANQQRLAFAMICVEVDISVEIPQTIVVKMKNGAMVSISVTIPWTPQKCSKCKIFGHLNKNCLKKASW